MRFIFLAFILHLFFFRDAGSAAYYVSPAGDDRNDGSVNAPFKTLEMARYAMRNSPVKKTYLCAGIHERSRTFVLTEEDSGTVWTACPSDGLNSAVIDGRGISDVVDILGGSGITINGLKVRNFSSRGIGIHGGKGWPNAAPFFDQPYGLAEGNVISNNIVEGGAVKTPCWDRAGINTEGNTPNTLITNNVVQNTTGYGIGVWALQEGDNITGTRIMNNVLLNTGSETKDGGAIYVIDGLQRSSSLLIKNNFIRDYGHSHNESRGIYLDNGLSNAAVEGNVIAGAGSEPLLIHGGSNIIIKRNVIDLGSDAARPVLACVVYGKGRMVNNQFVNNVILSSDGRKKRPPAFVKYGEVLPPMISHNLYFDYAGGVPGTTGNAADMNDVAPLHFDPKVSGPYYRIGKGSRLLGAPLRFVPVAVKYGPPGYVIPAARVNRASRER